MNIKSEKVEEEIEQNGTIMTKTQILLLQQQLRQHVQLTTQHFLQTCQHPLFSSYAKGCKVTLVNFFKIKLHNETFYLGKIEKKILISKLLRIQ